MNLKTKLAIGAAVIGIVIRNVMVLKKIGPCSPELEAMLQKKRENEQ